MRHCNSSAFLFYIFALLLVILSFSDVFLFDETEFERLAVMGPGLSPDAPYLEELQRVYGSLAVGALPPGMTPIPNVFTPPNIGLDVVQRERERFGNISLMVLLLVHL